MRIRQIIAALRPSGCSAAYMRGGIVLGGLLLPTAALHAASTGRAADTRSPHARHANLQSSGSQSSGKAPAHAVHDTDTHSSHTPDKAASHHDDRSSSHSHPAARKGSPSSKHPKDAENTRHTAKAQGGHERHKRQKQQLVDEPMPVNRAQLERNKRGGHETRTPLAAKAVAPRHASKPEPTPAVETAQIGTGLTTGDFLRGSRRATASANAPASLTQGASVSTPTPSPAFATGVSHPDDDERLAMHGAEPAPAFEYTPRPAAVPPATHTRPAPPPVTVATALSESAPPATQVVEGFGAEVDFHTPAVKPARSASIAMPKESAAQQERELRAAADIASQPMFVPLYARDGKLIVPPPLKGSHDILVHQNQMADDAGLTRIQDDEDLDRLRRARLLVDFPESASLHINEGLPENRRSARPWTVRFATDIAHSFYARFGEPLQLNSAVRTVAYQLRLQRTNGNAAAIDGEGASPHLTGQALDFGKRGMSVAQIAWMRSYLMPLIDAGKVDVEEEFQQACFHISVYATYMPAPKKPHVAVTTAVAQVSKAAHPHTATPVSDADDNLR